MNTPFADTLELRLHLTPASDGRGCRVALEGPDALVRFERLDELLRYLRALAEPNPPRGLR